MSDFNNIDRLVDFGFIEVGCWKLDETGEGIEKKPYNNYKLYSNKEAIYAFVVENIEYPVKYFGIGDPLNRRLNKYVTSLKGPKEERENIIKLLKDGYNVKFFAFMPNEDLSKNHLYKGLIINLVMGLEYPLINSFKTYITSIGWNKNH
jgi:hypothetical protein